MIKKTKIKNPIFIKNRLYKDRRGYFKELLRENELNIKDSKICSEKLDFQGPSDHAGRGSRLDGKLDQHFRALSKKVSKVIPKMTPKSIENRSKIDVKTDAQLERILASIFD